MVLKFALKSMFAMFLNDKSLSHRQVYTHK